MKRLIILFILSSFTLSANGLYTFGEFSYLPILIEQEKTDIWDNDNVNFYTSIGVGLEYKSIYIETELNTYIVKANSYMFQPYTQEYKIKAGYEYKIFKLQYEHLCAHSIDGLGNRYGHGKLSIMFDTRLNK